MAKEKKQKKVEEVKVEVKVEVPKEPQGVGIKDIAKQVGLEPRATRAILRGLAIRGEDQKRSRWIFKKEDAPDIVAQVKATLKAKEEAKVAKDEAEGATKEDPEEEE